MKEICKNCISCKPTYKGWYCECKGKNVKLQDSCPEWTKKRRRRGLENKDLIERQAAIEWCLEGLNNMPSAQPERTCVNCGRTANNGGWYADGRTRCPIEEHYALPKDGYCHLWEKRNVTDDDYPERREE